MVCLIPAQVAEIDGNGGGGPRRSAVAGPIPAVFGPIDGQGLVAG
jgi:hypothetical protein